MAAMRDEATSTRETAWLSPDLNAWRADLTRPVLGRAVLHGDGGQGAFEAVGGEDRALQGDEAEGDPQQGPRAPVMPAARTIRAALAIKTWLTVWTVRTRVRRWASVMMGA